MLTSNQVPYDLSRRRTDQFYAEVLREKPFDTIVFYCSRLSLKNRGGGAPCMQTLLKYIHSLGPVYTIPFSYENGMEMLSYENGIV